MNTIICLIVNEDSEFGFDTSTEKNLEWMNQQFGGVITAENVESTLIEQVEKFNCSVVDLDDPIEYIKSTNSPDSHGDHYDKIIQDATKFWNDFYDGRAFSMYDVTYEYDQIIMIVLNDDNLELLDIE